LTLLSVVLGESPNRLANEAIREYVAKRTPKVEEELESTLADLRAHRKSDPDFERAISAVVNAEVTTQSDPAEGRIVSSVGPGEEAILGVLKRPIGMPTASSFAPISEISFSVCCGCPAANPTKDRCCEAMALRCHAWAACAQAGICLPIPRRGRSCQHLDSTSCCRELLGRPPRHTSGVSNKVPTDMADLTDLKAAGIQPELSSASSIARLSASDTAGPVESAFVTS
jgi:hypothetical protein